MYDEKLVTENINLIYFILKKMHLYKKKEEYFDIGMIGLVKAAKKFDLNKGFAFNTYACSCIQTEILKDIRSRKSLKRKTNYNTISLNTIIYSKDDKDSEITLEDYLPSKINVEEEIIKKEQIKELHIALTKLNKKELNIIIYTFGLYGVNPLTQFELSKKYSVSQPQISRIIKKSINKLKKMLKEEI